MIAKGNPGWFSRLVWLAFAGTALATILSLLARQHWFFELFTHFRPYYLLVQVGLVLALFSWRRHAAVLVTLALALPNVWVVGPYISPLLVQESAAVTNGQSLNIVVINLNYRNHDHAAVIEYVRERSPDVVMFSELTTEWESRLSGLLSDYPYHLSGAIEGPFGMGLYSRVPASEMEITELGAADTINIRAVFDVMGQQLEFYGVHLMAPINPDWAATRITQFDALTDYLEESHVPGRVVVVAGDFNSTPFSPYFTEMLKETGLVDASRRYGFRRTWPTYALPLGIPIDHCLVSPGEAVAQVSLGPDLGSDHVPLEIVVGPVLAAN